MRFKSLDLDRYGRFSGHRIDFGDVPSGGDFHLVYGPNEAGKSTLRDACIDFLFGFPHQTKYNFLHANPVLQIGAEVTIGNVDHACRRIKRDSGSLLGLDGEALPDALFNGVLGDVARAGYEQMFSLDEDSLVQGGDEILKSEGDLGTLLFAAASGLSSLSSGFDGIRAEADGFFKKAGRTHRLKIARETLKELQDKIRDLDVQAGEFEALRRDETAKSELHAEARKTRDHNTARLDALKALLDAARPWNDLQALEQALNDISDAPDAPDGWLAEAEELAVNDASNRAALKESEEAAARARQAMAAITLDRKALDIAKAVRRLSEDDLEARYRTSQDIDNRRRELRLIEQDIADLCARLGRADTTEPKSLVLPAATLGRIQELIEQRSGLKAREETASEEAETAKERAATCATALEQLDAPNDLTEFARQIARLRDDLDGRAVEALQRRCVELAADRDAALAALMPWRGEADALVGLTIPDAAQLQRLKDTTRGLQEERTSLAAENERMLDEKAVLEAEVAALSRASGGFDDAAAQQARAARDSAWVDLRRDLVADPVAPRAKVETAADAFETGMAANDRIQDQRLGMVSEITELRRAGVALAKCQATLGRARERQAALTSRIEEHEGAVAALLTQLGLPQDTPLASLDLWLERRNTALGRIDALTRAQVEHKALSAQLAAAKADLGTTMRNADIDVSDPITLDAHTALARCDTAIEVWAEQKQAREKIEAADKEAQAEATKRAKRHEATRAALSEWDETWEHVIASTWIGKASPAEVRAIVGLLDAMSGKLEKADTLRLRVDAMGEDRKAYAAEVARLAEVSGRTFEGDTPLDIADGLRQLVFDAEDAARRHKVRAQELEQAEERLAGTTRAAQNVSQRIDEMTRALSAEDLDGLRIILKRSDEKRRLKSELARLEDQLIETLAVADGAAMRVMLNEQLASADEIVVLREELGSLHSARAAEDGHVATLYHDWKTAEAALKAVAGDGEVARLEEQRQVLLLDIEHEAHAFMRLSAGTLLVDDALRSYRETHRSSMMSRASDAFVKMTRGGFTGLVSAPGKKGEVLVGMRRDGSSIIAPEMSRGTQFQLYLALRIAGHADFTEKREALPFFADDILEPFDDDRSAETFTLLSDMSKRGQVVYLTHHRHLCELAKEVCGPDGITLHELPGRGD